MRKYRFARDAEMGVLDYHRADWPNCYGEGLSPKVASTGGTSAMSQLAAFGLHSTCLTEVGRL